MSPVGQSRPSARLPAFHLGNRQAALLRRHTVICSRSVGLNRGPVEVELRHAEVRVTLANMIQDLGQCIYHIIVRRCRERTDLLEEVRQPRRRFGQKHAAAFDERRYTGYLNL